MEKRNLRFAAAAGLIVGTLAAALGLLGYTQACSCPAQVYGQPSACDCFPAHVALPLVLIGLAIVILSAGGIAWSYLK